MEYAQHLRKLLRPLGVYDLSQGSLSGSELDALGFGLDQLSGRLDYVERESALATAEGEGLRRREALFARTPVQYSIPLRREAIAALLRIGGDSFTLAAINETVSGCGIKAVVQETDRFGWVKIVFPDVAGVPEGFEQIRSIILDIIPCHWEVVFDFRFLTWRECEEAGYTWRMLREGAYTWKRFELAVSETY